MQLFGQTGNGFIKDETEQNMRSRDAQMAQVLRSGLDYQPKDIEKR